MAKHSVKHENRRIQGQAVGGIDVARDWHYVQWLDVDGEPLGKALRFANSRSGFEAMWDRRPADAVRVGMESTGHYWFSLAFWLRARGADVVLVQPAHVHHAKELDDNSPTKSDAKDASVIARLVRDGRWLRWQPREGVWADLAALAVTRRQQHQEVVRWRTRITGWIHQYFPEFRQVFKAWDGKAALAALDTMPTPDLVCAEGVEAITRRFLAATHHCVGAKRAQALVQAAEDSIGVPIGRPAARRQLDTYLAGWRSAVAACEATETEQATRVADLPVARRLAPIPGFGPQVIATLLGELGDLTRFDVSRQAQKMAGLNLTHQSSGYHRGKTRIAKRGRPGARSALYQAACVAVASDPQWKAWYHHLTRRPVNALARKAALVAVATKLLRVAWACAKHQTAYDPQRLFRAVMPAA